MKPWQTFRKAVAAFAVAAPGAFVAAAVSAWVGDRVIVADEWGAAVSAGMLAGIAAAGAVYRVPNADDDRGPAAP